MVKIICFSCRKPVKKMRFGRHTVLVECDEVHVHTCKPKLASPEPDTSRDTDEETRDYPLEFRGRHLRLLKAA